MAHFWRPKPSRDITIETYPRLPNPVLLAGSPPGSARAATRGSMLQALFWGLALSQKCDAPQAHGSPAGCQGVPASRPHCLSELAVTIIRRNVSPFGLLRISPA